MQVLIAAGADVDASDKVCVCVFFFSLAIAFSSWWVARPRKITLKLNMSLLLFVMVYYVYEIRLECALCLSRMVVLPSRFRWRKAALALPND